MWELEQQPGAGHPALEQNKQDKEQEKEQNKAETRRGDVRSFQPTVPATDSHWSWETAAALPAVEGFVPADRWVLW